MFCMTNTIFYIHYIKTAIISWLSLSLDTTGWDTKCLCNHSEFRSICPVHLRLAYPRPICIFLADCRDSLHKTEHYATYRQLSQIQSFQSKFPASCTDISYLNAITIFNNLINVLLVHATEMSARTLFVSQFRTRTAPQILYFKYL